MKIYPTVSICVLAVTFFACSQSQETKERNNIISVADDFVENYFNYNFTKARQFCTDESILWLKFIASNIEQEDIDILREQPEGASFTAKGVDFINDTTAVAHYRIHNFMRIDTMGKAGKMTARADYALTLVKRHGKWRVRMEAPLQSERRNPD